MKVLITGIAGTVGTAFAELLSPDHEVVGVDRNETNVAQFRAKFPEIKVITGDFDEVILAGQRYDLIIHLAAMKHIDLCEASPNSCVLNNVIKTYQLFRTASQQGIKLLFMSTDKAVEPTSLYGYSKALAEGMVLEHGGAFARSGNVIEANGSVMHIWDEAIAKLAPVRVTHSEMRRFFITPQNLVKRIWELYQSGEKVIIPEMDRDILLMDLLAEKLAKYGYTVSDYPGGIEFIGLRPGEKLEEKLQ